MWYLVHFLFCKTTIVHEQPTQHTCTARVALQLARRLRSRGMPWSLEHPSFSSWQTLDYRSLVALLHVSETRLDQSQFWLSVSTSVQNHSWAPCCVAAKKMTLIVHTHVLPRDLASEIVFIQTDLIRLCRFFLDPFAPPAKWPPKLGMAPFWGPLFGSEWARWQCGRPKARRLLGSKKHGILKLGT